jgi:hypothetical protein
MVMGDVGGDGEKGRGMDVMRGVWGSLEDAKKRQLSGIAPLNSFNVTGHTIINR